MKCERCDKEIDDDSVFCENCGAKVKKKATWKWWIIGGVVITGLVIGILAIHYFSKTNYEDTRIATWPPCCEEGKGTYSILQKGKRLFLVRIENEFPFRLRKVGDIYGKILACEGEHSGMGAFAFLGDNGRITFVTDYDERGNLINGLNAIGSEILYSDENHIYGVTADNICGEGRENVKTIFPNGYGQPVKQTNGKWRYLNIGETFMFEDEFDDAYPFCYGKARVCKDGRWYYIDGNNHKLVIHNDYDGQVAYKILEGEDFHYDDNKQKVVAKMLLKRYSHPKDIGNDYWALVDDTGKIVESGQQRGTPEPPPHRNNYHDN